MTSVKHENGDAIIFHEAVNGVEEIEQKLADDFEYAEVHNLRFVVLKLRQTMVNFRACADLEARGVGLAWLQLKSRHAHRAFDANQVLRGRDSNERPQTPIAFALSGAMIVVKN